MPNIYNVLKKYEQKTNLSRMYRGRVVSIAGNNCYVESNGTVFNAQFPSDSVIVGGDTVIIEKDQRTNQWFVVGKGLGQQNRSDINRSNLDGSGLLTSIATATTHPTAPTFSVANGIYVDVSNPLEIFIRKPRILVMATLDVFTNSTGGRVDFQVRVSIDEETFLSTASTVNRQYGAALNQMQHYPVVIPVVDLPVGLRDVTIQAACININAGATCTIATSLFSVMEV